MRHVAAIVLAGVVPALACGTATDVERVLDVTVELSAARLAPFDSVWIQVVATNRGKADFVINGKTCPAAFLILDADANVVGPPPQICTLETRPVVLARGESFIFYDWWKGGGAADRLPAGTYSVVGRVASALGVAHSPPASIQLES